MSFTPNGVKVNKPKKGLVVLTLITLAEFVLSVLFVISLAGPMLFPNNQARAAAGVSDILSYQGRLTDSSGNPLTNTYCFRFSIYDALSGGNNTNYYEVGSNMKILGSGGDF